MSCSHLGQAPPIGTGPLSVEEVLVLIAYVGTIALLLTGPSHLWRSRWRSSEPPWFLEKTVYAPACGVIFLSLINYLRGETKSLVTGAALAEVMRDKIPIVLLIQSFAYLSISLDISGFFEECARYIVVLARGDGHRLLLYLYILCSVLTYFTSNDIVIISVTPIIIHVGVKAGIKNVIPLLIVQFIAANTSSMGLYVGSPTNIILGDAVGLTFTGYWIMMLLPTTVAVLTTLGMLWLVFIRLPPIPSNAMQKRFQEEEKEQEPPVSNSMVAAIADTHSDADGIELGSMEPSCPRETEAQHSDPAGSSISSSHTSLSLMRKPQTRQAKVAVFLLVLLLLSLSSYVKVELWLLSFLSALGMLALDLTLVWRERKAAGDGKGRVLSYLRQVYSRMPWSIGPFVICMFLLVRVLSDAGFTGRFAGWMIAAGGKSLFRQTLAYGYISALLVNVFNDLPSTVFWANMVRLLCEAYPKANYTGVLMALLVGVNPGCYLTIIGALAGLMWRNIILTQPGSSKLVVPKAWHLTFYGALVLGPVIFLSCSSIAMLGRALGNI